MPETILELPCKFGGDRRTCCRENRQTDIQTYTQTELLYWIVALAVDCQRAWWSIVKEWTPHGGLSEDTCCVWWISREHKVSA